MFRQNNRVRDVKYVDELVQSGYEKLNDMLYGNVFEGAARDFLTPKVNYSINN